MQPLRATQGLFSVSSAGLRPTAPLRAVEPPVTSFSTPDGRSFTVPTDGTAFALGRRSSNDASFEHSHVSRHHAELRVQGGQLQVRDLGSSYGTFLNGTAVKPQTWVAVPAEAELVLGQGGPRLSFGAARVSSTELGLIPRPAGPPQAAHPDSEPVAAGLTRNTVGWSGPGPHQKLIEHGQAVMDRVAPGLRQRLDKLFGPTLEPETQARLDTLQDEQMALYQANGKLLALPLDSVQAMMGPQALVKRQGLDQRLDEIFSERELFSRAERSRRAHNNRQATELGKVFLDRLRESNGTEARNVGEKVQFTPAAVAKLAEQNLAPEQVRAWVNEYHQMTGLPIPPNLTFTYKDGRPRYEHSATEVNLGDYFDKRLCMHELTHRVEYVRPELSAINKGWVRARCEAAGFEPNQPFKLLERHEGSRYEKGELALDDHFVNDYVGKLYPDAATEVLTVGIEHFANGERLAQLYRQDPEHLFLVLGALDKARQG